MVPGCVTNAQSDGWAWNRKIFKELLEIINCDKISLPFCNTLKEQFNLMCRLALDSLSLSPGAGAQVCKCRRPKNKHRSRAAPSRLAAAVCMETKLHLFVLLH